MVKLTPYHLSRAAAVTPRGPTDFGGVSRLGGESDEFVHDYVFADQGSEWNDSASAASLANGGTSGFRPHSNCESMISHSAKSLHRVDAF